MMKRVKTGIAMIVCLAGCVGQAVGDASGAPGNCVVPSGPVACDLSGTTPSYEVEVSEGQWQSCHSYADPAFERCPAGYACRANGETGHCFVAAAP